MSRGCRLLSPFSLLVILLAGCGEDPVDGYGSGVAAALARAGYIERADRVCERARGALEDAAGAAFTGLGPTEQPRRAAVAAFVDRKVSPVIAQTLGELRRIRPPAEDRRRIETILASARAASRELAADPRLVVDRARDPFLDANRRARAYGFRSCGSITPSAFACAVSDAACRVSRDGTGLNPRSRARGARPGS